MASPLKIPLRLIRYETDESKKDHTMSAKFEFEADDGQRILGSVDGVDSILIAPLLHAGHRYFAEIVPDNTPE